MIKKHTQPHTHPCHLACLDFYRQNVSPPLSKRIHGIINVGSKPVRGRRVWYVTYQRFLASRGKIAGTKALQYRLWHTKKPGLLGRVYPKRSLTYELPCIRHATHATVEVNQCISEAPHLNSFIPLTTPYLRKRETAA